MPTLHYVGKLQWGQEQQYSLLALSQLDRLTYKAKVGCHFDLDIILVEMS